MTEQVIDAPAMKSRSRDYRFFGQQADYIGENDMELRTVHPLKLERECLEVRA